MWSLYHSHVTTSRRTFIVARNPDPGSRLPYLLRLPLVDAPILKARDTWPRTARVFCHRSEGWPEEAEVLEAVPVVSCVRRGVAIDLVLDRPRENRSQFVFTTLPTGHEGIFWQTRKVVGTARPGARIPTRRISDVGSIAIVIDTRERYPYRFAKQQATTLRQALPAGRYSALLAHRFSPGGFLPDLLARVQIRYPETPIVFCDTRPLAEEWTYRWLGAALAELSVRSSE